MKNRYTIEAKSNPNMIYAGIILIVINAILVFSKTRITDVNNFTREQATIEVIVHVVALILSIWAMIVAKKLNRSAIFWGLFTFILTPISLIILGTKDIAIQTELRKVFNKYKSDYFLEKFKLGKDLQKGKIDQKTHDEIIAKIQIEYDNAMNDEIRELELKIEERHKEIIIEKVAGNGRAIIVRDKCPACETKISADTEVCPDCGLSLK